MLTSNQRTILREMRDELRAMAQQEMKYLIPQKVRTDVEKRVADISINFLDSAASTLETLDRYLGHAEEQLDLEERMGRILKGGREEL